MPSNRRALVVGINQFKNLPDAALRGCVNDTVEMNALLKAYAGFAAGDIITLTDAQATKASILGHLTDLVNGAKAGQYSYLVFSLSSHGTQVPDRDGDEPDRADEAFCPHDLAVKDGEWDPDHIITDDELRDLFVQLPQSTLLEVYLDTCHSGTGLRGIDLLLDRKPRYLPPPSVEAFEEVEGTQSRGLGRALLERGVVHHILWTGCRSDQTSADALIEGKWRGAFTYYYGKHLRAAKGKISRKALLKKVRAELKANRYTQVPQLECQATVRNAKVA
jgi:hypothetical protein